MKRFRSTGHIEGKITAYLSGNLPDSEPRLPQPMAPGCEVCVVVPAYGEREYILRPLESLACQKNVEPGQYEVIVVINNPASPPPLENRQGHGETEAHQDIIYKKRVEFYHQAVMDNRETLKLLRYIKREANEEDIRLSSQEEVVVKRIRRSGLKLYVIDKASPGMTLPEGEANVGGARNRGVAEAVERFYNHLCKNGIIAQTDADTWVDENYIYNLIKVFRENPHWIAVSGKVEEIVYQPEDSAKMRAFNNSVIKTYYYRLLSNVFTNRLAPGEVTFFGCNTASRAYETAAVGGVPKITGHEDTFLGKRFTEIGRVGFAPDVIVSAAVRYSARAATGRGHDLIDYSETIKQKGTIEVRSFDAELFIQGLLGKLREMTKNGQTSPQHLMKLVTANVKSIFSNEDLAFLLEGIRQLDFSSDTFEDDFKLISDKISAAVDNIMKPICIKEAADLLLRVYYRVEEIKKEFHSVKTRMIQHIKEYSGILEDVLAEIFKDNPRELDPDNQRLTHHIISILERNGNHLAAPFLKNRGVINHLAELIAAARTKQEALEMLQANYMAKLLLPQKDSLEDTYLDLRALYEAIENTRPDRPVFHLMVKVKR